MYSQTQEKTTKMESHYLILFAMAVYICVPYCEGAPQGDQPQDSPLGDFAAGFLHELTGIDLRPKPTISTTTTTTTTKPTTTTTVTVSTKKPLPAFCACDVSKTVTDASGTIRGNCKSRARGKLFCYVSNVECGEDNTGRYANTWINYSLCEISPRD